MAAPGAHHGPDFAGAAAALGDDPAARARLQQLEDQQRQLQAAKKRLAKDIANEQRKKARKLIRDQGLMQGFRIKEVRCTGHSVWVGKVLRSEHLSDVVVEHRV